MLPAAYQLPAAAVLVAGGLLSCLVGYRLFKVVLAIFGFIIGGLAASSVFGESAATAMVIAAVVGGLCGAFLLLAAYFVGVALVGAGLGVACVHLVWTQIQGDPHPAVVILGAVAGALLSTWLQRYVIILGTAFGGAWTVVVGAAALLGNPTALKAAAGGDVWVAYPMNPAPGQGWVPWTFLALGAVGTLVQMYWTGGDRGRVGKRKVKAKKEDQ
jgi:MFS family permease